MISDARHAVSNGDGGKATTILESKTTNGGHTVWNGDRGKTIATIERTFSNTHHTVGDGNRGQAVATRERTSVNARHTVRNGDGGKFSATMESTTSYTCHVIRDNRILASYNQCIRGSLYNSITFIPGVIFRIATSYCNGSKMPAVIEHILADVCQAAAYDDRCKT